MIPEDVVAAQPMEAHTALRADRDSSLWKLCQDAEYQRALCSDLEINSMLIHANKCLIYLYMLLILGQDVDSDLHEIRGKMYIIEKKKENREATNITKVRNSPKCSSWTVKQTAECK